MLTEQSKDQLVAVGGVGVPPDGSYKLSENDAA